MAARLEFAVGRDASVLCDADVSAAGEPPEAIRKRRTKSWEAVLTSRPMPAQMEEW